MGMIYALMAMGLILIVKAVGVINFAQGELFMIGAYITFLMTAQAAMPLYIAIICAVVIFLIFGALYMFSVYWPLRNSSWTFTVIISTLGASLAMKEAVRLIWGPYPLTLDHVIPGALTIGDAHIEYQYIVIMVVGIVLISFVFLLFEKMRIGRVLQAAAQDRYAAELLGIPTVITIAATFMISATMAGIGGWLAAPLFLVSQSLGSFALKAFAGAVVGGFGSIKGALIGSLIIGVVEAFGVLITSTYKDAIVFLVLILVLLVRPQGIFGERIGEKA